ncbi:MAG: deoxyribonuclease IV [Limnochordia bacterium]|jgi:deoxyribonuclease-4
MRIGCHMSVAKGFAAMLRRAVDLDADVVQYFPKNPKSFRVRAFDKEAFAQEAAKVQELDIITVCHSPYVTNLSTPKPELRAVSIASIVNDLEIADAYGTPYLVVHCGKHVGEGPEAGTATMVEVLEEVLARFEGKTQLLLENTAGQGTELGRTTDELLEIHTRLSTSERVGFCFDTCHAYAAGLLDFSRWDEVRAELGRPEFAAKVQVLHLNDSKMGYGAKRDRHALLGEGEIGDNLRLFLQSGLYADKPIVIETPVDAEEEYRDEIRKVRGWLAG